MVFFKDKTHLEDCPNGRIDEAPAVKVDLSPKSDAEDLDSSSMVLEQDEGPDMEKETKANVPATKFTCSNDA